MNTNQLHFISDGEREVVFHTESLSLFTVNALTRKCIERLQEGYSPEAIANELNISPEEIASLQNKLASLDSVAHPSSQANANRRVVTRITLHVTNDCNLRCRYCYAHGGGYNDVRKIMSLQQAKEFVTFVVENFDSVGQIVFFGGEPFLNPSIISYICEELVHRCNEGALSHLPKFGAITNGTIASNTVFSLIEKYFSFVTVSIDGDQMVHDINRITVDGKGTFSVIEKFIDRLRSIKDLLVRYEATYTRQHIERGVSRQQVQEYLQQRFQINGVVNDEYRMEQAAITQEVSGKFLSRGKEEAYWDVLPKIVYKQRGEMCPIAKDIFSISVDGDIYPCHMNTGEANDYLGNISGENIFNSSIFDRDHFYLTKSLKSNESCSACWARTLCGGCARLWFYSEEEKIFRSLPNTDACEANKQHFEEALLQITELRRSPNKWAELLASLKKQTKHA